MERICLLIKRIILQNLVANNLTRSLFRKIIRTERLILRPHSMDDIQEAFEMNADPLVTRYTHDGGTKSKDEIEKLISELINGDYRKYGFGRFALELMKSGEFIGFSGLKYLPEEDEVDLGYRLKRKYWGRGLATEAGQASLAYGFDELDLEKIVAYVLPDNMGSIAVLKKLNFSYHSSEMDNRAVIYKYQLTRDKYYSL